jgi:plastin-1
VFGTLYDAAEVCDLLAQVNPNVMDIRCIHRPESVEEPFPLTDKQVRENVNLLLSSCKAIALRLPSYEAKIWMEPRSHAPLLVAVLHALAKEKLKNYVNFEKHPEIVRLLTQQELNDDPEKVKNEILPDEVLKRWMNFSLGRPMSTDIGNIAVDLYNTLQRVDPQFPSNAPELRNGVINKAAAELLVHHLKNSMGIQTNIEPQDVMDGNLKLDELMAARAFDLTNGLPPLSDAERAKYRALWTDDNHDDDAYLPFLNSQLPPHLRITNLYRDLSDGIVLARILERSKPGCINWRKLQKNIRHKFDKVNNCNYAYQVMQKQFPFKLIGIGGTDIVDGHQKYIHTILWQIMRYQATKTLSELSFNGKPVSDKDILNWAQGTHGQLPDRRTPTVSGFRDRTLTTCIFYIELLKVISGDGFVNEDLVHFDVPVLRGSQEDGHMKERMDNGRYAIGLIRRHGGDIFILPEDLVIMEPKAVLSVFAALMTIDFQSKDENQKNNSNSNQNNNSNMEDVNQAEKALYDGGFSG